MNTPIYYCSFPGCCSSPDAKLLKFPSDDFLRTSFLEAIGRTDLNYVENVRENYFICSEHFDGSPHGLDEVERIEDIYQCSACHIMLNSLDEVQSHVNACPATSNEQCIEPRSPPSSCGIIRKGANDDSNVDRNYSPAAKNKEEQSCECLHCNKTFASHVGLKNHMKLHKNERPFACHICNKSFVLRSCLNTHLKKFHTDKKYRCPVSGCTKEYKTEQYLKVHALTHSNQLNFECFQCGKKFIVKQSLRLHTRSHTGERPYECKICGKRFTQTTHLRTHERIHTEDKPFVCGVCGRCFRQVSNLNEHTAAYHA